jgi:pimeloyl-ACP methyl ester carboxylesterase
MGSIITSLAFPRIVSSYDENIPFLDFVIREELSFSSITSHKIPIRYYQLGKEYPTILMCHGNAEDIGQIDPMMVAKQFNANICLFDYAGYGLHSCRQPSEYSCQKDVIAVYKHLVDIKNIPRETIVIYGRSLGTGIACYLAHYLCKKQIYNRLILVSPLMSAASVTTNIWIPGDIFRNYALAPKIRSCTLILHGNCDQVVPYSCGQDLSKLFPNLYDMIVLEGCGHNDIFVPTYYESIDNFLKNT